MSAVVVCNGTVNDYGYFKRYLDGADTVICADGGAVHINKMGYMPDMIVGDFDSLPEDLLCFYKQKGVEIKKFPVQKDMTDGELAINYLIELGHKSIIVLGGLGDRADHSLANIFLLKKMLDKGCRGIVAHENNEITIVKDYIEICKDDWNRLSILPLSEKVKGVTLEGLYYSLDKQDMGIGSTLGISNEFIKEKAKIKVEEGILLVIKSREK